MQQMQRASHIPQKLRAGLKTRLLFVYMIRCVMYNKIWYLNASIVIRSLSPTGWPNRLTAVWSCLAGIMDYINLEPD